MGRAPCCDKSKVKKGPWSPQEDTKLKDYIHKNGTGGNWIALPHKAGLKRCGKSCRLRWLNYLRPDIKHGEFSDHEDRLIYTLFSSIGSRWSVIAAQLPGRTDNDIKNYWNTKLKKKIMNFISTNHQTEKPLHHLEFVNCPSSNYSYPTSSSVTTVDNHPVLPSDDHGYINVDMETYRVKDNSTLFMLEGDAQAADCSSNSDGRWHHVYGSGAFDAHNNMGGLKTSNSYMGVDGNYCEKARGCYGDSTMEFSLEEFKKLISTNLCSSNTNNNLNVFVDELKAEENIMYY